MALTVKRAADALDRRGIRHLRPAWRTRRSWQCFSSLPRRAEEGGDEVFFFVDPLRLLLLARHIAPSRSSGGTSVQSVFAF